VEKELGNGHERIICFSEEQEECFQQGNAHIDFKGPMGLIKLGGKGGEGISLSGRMMTGGGGLKSCE